MSSKVSIGKVLKEFDIIIAAIALIVLIASTFLGVIMRYFLNDPFIWLQEVQLWCFTWIVFFGGGAAFRAGAHVRIEVIVDRLPPVWRKVIHVFGYFTVMAILSYFMIYGAKLIVQLIQTERTTNILDIPYPIIYSAFPVGCGLMMVNYTVVTLSSLFKEKREERL